MISRVPLSDIVSDSSSRRTLSNISLAVAKSKKIVVVTGAGISCSCGIPDFRSSDGLYNMVKQQYPDVVLKGRDLFDSSLFRDPTSTSVFYTFISKLKQSIDDVSPSPTHWFMKTLDSKGKLLRSYTQNIDGLEERVGLLGSSSSEAKSAGSSKGKIKFKDVKNIQLHGDIRLVRCTCCSAEFPFTHEHTYCFDNGMAPDCPDCAHRSAARVARSARALRIGTLRPAIVLYDEPHPLGDDIGCIETADLARKPDLLVIMGTSLKVHGLKKLVKEFARAVHASGPGTKNPSANNLRGKVIFVNKTAPTGEWDDVIDYHIEGETDEWVERVLEDWKRMRPADWEIQTKLDGEQTEHTIPFKVAKESIAVKHTKGKARRRKANWNSENVPPVPAAKPAAANLPLKPVKACESTVVPPSSPSKRRNHSCHYAPGECSPSKKKPPPRTVREAERAEVSPEERGLLFGKSRSANVVVDIDLDSDEIAKRNFKKQLDALPVATADMSLDADVIGVPGPSKTQIRTER